MDSLLCDELLIEIFHRLPPPPPSLLSSSSSLHHQHHNHHQVSLVSKRWLHLSRLSTTSLNLTLLSPHLSPSLISSFLSRYPFLSSLSLTYSPSSDDAISSSSSSLSFDILIVTIAACFPSKLNHLLLNGPPISPTSLSHLFSSSFTATNLHSLSISLPRPFNFSSWLPQLPSLKTLTLLISDNPQFFHPTTTSISDPPPQTTDTILPIENLTLSGINRGDVGMCWLWRSCRLRLRRLRMSLCEGVGVGGTSFKDCLRGVEEVELRSCRPAMEKLLTDMMGNCDRLNSLLVYDGGSRDGLLEFFMNSNCSENLMKIDLRLPLDLDNRHLLAMASRFHHLRSVRLQSCVLSTGEGLENLITSLTNSLQELSLINCDVVHKVPGLLTTLSQNLRQLKRLDLSHNEMLSDKELISMLASCTSLIELKLRGCGRLTTASIAFLPRTCKLLERLDLMCCGGIKGEDNVMESLMLNLPRLRRVEIEDCKMSDSGWRLAERRVGGLM